MTKDRRYPTNYKPIANLKICSNTLIGGGSLLEILDNEPFIPIIVGNGETPIIWLNVKSDKTPIVSIVSENRSKHPSIKVFPDRLKRQVMIKSGETIILRASMKTNNHGSICIVDKLDLRPIGFQVYGDENQLTIGNSTLKDSSFNEVSFAMGINITE